MRGALHFNCGKERFGHRTGNEVNYDERQVDVRKTPACFDHDFVLALSSPRNSLEYIFANRILELFGHTSRGSREFYVRINQEQRRVKFLQKNSIVSIPDTENYIIIHRAKFINL